ncbi:hypothetical protein ACE6H2_006025 [Prunus campanulata]
MLLSLLDTEQRMHPLITFQKYICSLFMIHDRTQPKRKHYSKYKEPGSLGHNHKHLPCQIFGLNVCLLFSVSDFCLNIGFFGFLGGETCALAWRQGV